MPTNNYSTCDAEEIIIRKLLEDFNKLYKGFKDNNVSNHFFADLFLPEDFGLLKLNSLAKELNIEIRYLEYTLLFYKPINRDHPIYKKSLQQEIERREFLNVAWED